MTGMFPKWRFKMSVSYKLTNCTGKTLLKFILDEHQKDTGLPVHPFSHLDKVSPYYRSIGLLSAKETGCFFIDGQVLTAWGKNNWMPIFIALRQCNVRMVEA